MSFFNIFGKYMVYRVIFKGYPEKKGGDTT
jgi:hypothetical protein